jgi:hypothetical protein
MMSQIGYLPGMRRACAAAPRACAATHRLDFLMLRNPISGLSIRQDALIPRAANAEAFR